MAEESVRVDAVVVPRKRLRVANHVEELAGSIEKNGLLHPITLRRAGKALILVAGRRRLEAVRLLRWDTVRANVLTIGETEALLIEIDENLQRAELTALARAEHVVERKKVWESLYPQTKHGGAPGAGQGKGKKPICKDELNSSFQNGQPVPSFTEATAGTLQATRRTVEHYTQIGSNVCKRARDLLKGTPVEDRKTDLLHFARLKDRDQQVRVARLIHQGQACTFQRARKILEAQRIRAEPRPLPRGPFRVLVADPPWSYAKRDSDGSKRENTPYSDMTLEEIKALPVAAVAADDSVLWLWTTNAHLPEAFAVASAWGFTYKTLLTWDKVRLGMGDWLRGQTEHCLFCVRGKPAVVLAGQSTLLRETSAGHSVKPEAFYTLVEELCPGSRVELFARKPRRGWRAWGAQCPPREIPPP